MMEQIHYRLKERIINYSISKQKERRKETRPGDLVMPDPIG